MMCYISWLEQLSVWTEGARLPIVHFAARAEAWSRIFHSMLMRIFLNDAIYSAHMPPPCYKLLVNDSILVSVINYDFSSLTEKLYQAQPNLTLPYLR
jgi:hypothetical protein